MSLPSLFKNFKKAQATQLIFLGLLVGIFSGLGAVLFRWLISGVKDLAFGTGGDIFTVMKLAGWPRRDILSRYNQEIRELQREQSFV